MQFPKLCRKVGIRPGSILHYKNDADISVMITPKYNVVFKEEVMPINQATREASGNNYGDSSFRHWRYKCVLLGQIRTELQKIEKKGQQ